MVHSHLVKAEAKKNKEQVKGIKEEKKTNIRENFRSRFRFFSVWMGLNCFWICLYVDLYSNLCIIDWLFGLRKLVCV